RPLRRVRANAATANAVRMVAAVAARDPDAFDTLFTDDVGVIHHPTGAVYERLGALANYRRIFRAEDLTFAKEPLATLGDSLALTRTSWSASATSGGRFDVGAYESSEIDLIEGDAQGRCRRREVFATDRLGDAIARLYQRYADLLPDGPARTRAA